MNARSWLRSLASRSDRPARTAPAHRPAFRPRLEGLDDRCLPSTLGYSTALPFDASAIAVDSAGDTVVSTGSGGATTGAV